MVHHEEVCLGCWYARSTGGWWNGSWKDFHLGCSCNHLPIADWESCTGVATVHLIGEYHWRVGDYGAQRLSRYRHWRIGLVSAREIQFCAPPPVWGPDYTTSWASSTCISPGTNPGGYNACSGRDLQDCHWQHDTWNWFLTGQLVAGQKCKSHPRGSGNQYWRPIKPREYPACAVWYHNIQNEPIKQRPTLLLSKECWDFRWVTSVQD